MVAGLQHRIIGYTPHALVLEGSTIEISRSANVLQYHSLVVSDRPSNKDTIVMQNGKFSFVEGCIAKEL